MTHNSDDEFICSMIGRPYCIKNENGINCWGVISEYYSKKGIKLFNYVLNTLSPRELNTVFTIALTEGHHGFKPATTPVNGDVVLFKHHLNYHCGLWLNGKVLHSVQNVGVLYQPLSDIRGFSGYEYWTKK